MMEEAKIQSCLDQVARCVKKGNGYVISTHCMYPSGEHVSIHINKTGKEYFITDASSAFLEVLSYGIDVTKTHLKRAAILSDAIGAVFDKGEFSIRDVSESNLAAAILWLANFVQKWVGEISYDYEIKMEEQLKLQVNENLHKIFFKEKIKQNVALTGLSTKKYTVDNIVYLEQRKKPLIVDVIPNHHNAISASYLKHSDIKKNTSEYIHEAIIDNHSVWKAENINVLSDVFDGVLKASNLDPLKKLALPAR